jgi:hypothetical protein
LRAGGKLKESDNVGKSLSHDGHKKATSGQDAKGDR